MEVDGIKMSGQLLERGIEHGFDGAQGMILGNHSLRGEIVEHGLG